MKKFLSLITLISTAITPAFAIEEIPIVERTKEDKKGNITVNLENDLFAGTDRRYTHGSRIAYTSSEEAMPSFIRKAGNYLPLLAKTGKKRIGVAIGQNIYTPSNYHPQPIFRR